MLQTLPFILDLCSVESNSFFMSLVGFARNDRTRSPPHRDQEPPTNDEKAITIWCAATDVIGKPLEPSFSYVSFLDLLAISNITSKRATKRIVELSPNFNVEPHLGTGQSLHRDNFSRARFIHPPAARRRIAYTECVFGFVVTPLVVRQRCFPQESEPHRPCAA